MAWGRRAISVLAATGAVSILGMWSVPRVVALFRPSVPTRTMLGRLVVFGDIDGLSACESDMAPGDSHPAVDPVGCMIRIPAGRFFRGAQAADPGAVGYDSAAAPDEGPVREVRLSSFWVHRNEVTAHQFNLCVQRGACRVEDVQRGDGFTFGISDGFQPINGVTWNGARDYCSFIGGRLPTEAEWEFAARGPESWRYPWGRDPPTCAHAHYADAGGVGCGRDQAINVQMFAQNANVHMNFRLFHMAGNVWEWVADWYHPEAYRSSDVSNPTGPSSGERRVVRGGGWADDAAGLRSAARAALVPELKLDDVGFRCAADRVDSRSVARQQWDDLREELAPAWFTD